MGNRDLVVIGGSAGSVGPLRTILRALPADFPAAIAITMHMPSTSTGIFATIASTVTALHVETARDGISIDPGKVYLAAPNHHLIIDDGSIRLGTGPRENLVRPAIDPLFRSAAASYGPRAIGIILSGMLNDGADGLRAIKRCGGTALVQAPQDCIASDMPLAALAATPVDLSAEAEKLGPALDRFVREEAGPPTPVPPDILLEVEIALGANFGSELAGKIGKPAALTCPDCGGVLSEVNGSHPLRFRCQVGHGYTAKTLAQEQEGSVDEAMRVALRIIEERAELVGRMGRDAGEAGRASMEELYAGRAAEYRGYADTLRSAVLKLMRERAPPDEADVVRTQVIGQELEPD
jgi:two-component system chemotaxis response regulator CheB